MPETKTDNAICRIVTEDEMPQVEKLWEQCFDDTLKFVIWYFARYWKAENTLGIFEQRGEENVLCASAQVIPYEVRIRNTSLPCGYIVGVDTAPEARNKGYAKRLLKESLQMQREHQQAISLLMPFEGQFYYRYGWPFCYFHQQILTDPQELRCAAKAWGTVRKADLFEAKQELQRVYGQFTARYHGVVCRTEKQWQLQLEDANLEHTICFLIEDEQQTVQGYFLWTPLKGKCFVREMAWCHERAKAGMLYYLMQNVAEGDKIWLELPEDDALKYQMATAKKDVVDYPFLMARIVDVAQCLELLQYPVKEAELILSVQDGFAQWNTGIYHMILCDYRATVSKITAAEKKKQMGSDIPAIVISIDGLSQLVMGARSAEELLRQESWCCEKQESADDTLQQEKVMHLLQQLWPKQSNYINEYY